MLRLVTWPLSFNRTLYLSIAISALGILIIRLSPDSYLGPILYLVTAVLFLKASFLSDDILQRIACYLLVFWWGFIGILLILLT